MKRVTLYAHASREAAYDAAYEAGLRGDALSMASYMGTEIRMTYELDERTGRATLVEVDDVSVESHDQRDDATVEESTVAGVIDLVNSLGAQGSVVFRMDQRELSVALHQAEQLVNVRAVQSEIPLSVPRLSGNERWSHGPQTAVPVQGDVSLRKLHESLSAIATDFRVTVRRHPVVDGCVILEMDVSSSPRDCVVARVVSPHDLPRDVVRALLSALRCVAR